MNFFNNFGSMTTLITIVPFIIVVLVLVFIAMRGRRTAGATKSWPVTTGRVLMSNVELRHSSGSSGHSSSYYPNVVYEYLVSGQTFTSNSIYPGTQVGLGFRGRVEQRVARYPVGSMVQVYYNPMNPGQTVLEHDAPGSRILLWVAVFVVLILVCTLAMTFGAFGFAGQFINQMFGQFAR